MSAPGPFLEMDTAGVERAAKALGDVGRLLDTGWRGSRAALTGHEAGIGSDLLGQAFRGVYAADRDSTAAAADRLPASIAEAAAVGTHSAAAYREADLRGRAALPR